MQHTPAAATTKSVSGFSNIDRITQEAVNAKSYSNDNLKLIRDLFHELDTLPEMTKVESISLRKVTHIDLSKTYLRTCNGRIQLLINSCPNLKKIVLNDVRMMTSLYLDECDKGLANVEEIDLSDNQDLQILSARPNKMPQVFEKLLKCSFAGCISLKEFTLTGFVSRFPNLRDVNLSGCYQFTNGAVASIGLHCKKIEILDISDCIQMNADVLETVGHYFKDLQSLKSTLEVNEVALKKLIASCPKLVAIQAGNLTLDQKAIEDRRPPEESKSS